MRILDPARASFPHLSVDRALFDFDKRTVIDLYKCLDLITSRREEQASKSSTDASFESQTLEIASPADLHPLTGSLALVCRPRASGHLLLDLVRKSSALRFSIRFSLTPDLDLVGRPPALIQSLDPNENLTSLYPGEQARLWNRVP